MIKAMLFDFSRTILFPKDQSYAGELNGLHRKLSLISGYDFFKNFELNEELMTFIETLKVKYKVYMFTSGTIQNAPEIRDKVEGVFDKVFSADELMISKKEPESYKKVAEMIAFNPQDILFVDDLQSNIEAAKIAGMDTFLYTDNHKLMDFISALE